MWQPASISENILFTSGVAAAAVHTATKPIILIIEVASTKLVQFTWNG
jgi:hypothetical protein